MMELPTAVGSKNAVAVAFSMKSVDISLCVIFFESNTQWVAGRKEAQKLLKNKYCVAKSTEREIL